MYHLRHILFQIVLHGGIQRQHQIVAVLLGKILLIFREHIPLIGGLGRNHQAGLALQLVFIACFQTVQAGIFAAHEADHMGGQRAVRIVALGVRHHVYAANVVFIDQFAYLVGQLFLRPQLDDLVLRVGVVHPLQDTLLVYIQNPRQLSSQKFLCPLGRIFLVVLRFLDLHRREEHRFRRGGDGHDIAVAVVDRPAARRHHRTAHLLVGGLGLQRLMLHDLQIVQLEKQYHKQQHAHDQHQHKGAALDHAVCAPDFFRFTHGILRHAFRLPVSLMPSKEQEVTLLTPCVFSLYGAAHLKYSTAAPIPSFTVVKIRANRPSAPL